MQADAPRILQVGALRIDYYHHNVQVGGQEVRLTRTEFDLLWALALAQGGVGTRAGLIAQVWGTGTYVDPRTVTTHIARQRRKLSCVAATTPTCPCSRRSGESAIGWSRKPCIARRRMRAWSRIQRTAGGSRAHQSPGTGKRSIAIMKRETLSLGFLPWW
jgi:hypothetical protein